MGIILEVPIQEIISAIPVLGMVSVVPIQGVISVIPILVRILVILVQVFVESVVNRTPSKYTHVRKEFDTGRAVGCWQSDCIHFGNKTELIIFMSSTAPRGELGRLGNSGDE